MTQYLFYTVMPMRLIVNRAAACILFLGFVLTAFATGYYQDIGYRRQQLANAQTAAQQVAAMNELAYDYSLAHMPDSCAYWANTALALAQKTNDTLGIITSYNRLGIAARKEGNYPLAKSFLFKAISISQSINNQLGVARNQNHLMLTYNRAGRPDSAIAYGKASANTFGALNDYSRQVQTLLSLGDIYGESGKYDSSLYILNQALEISMRQREHKYAARAYHEMGIVHRNMNNYVAALANFNKSIALFTELGLQARLARVNISVSNVYFDQKNYTQAKKYLDSAIAYYRQRGAPLTYEINNSLGMYFGVMGQYDSARYHHSQALAIARKNNLYDKQLKSYNNTANMLFRLGNYAQAFELLLRAKAIAKQINSLRDHVDVLRNISSKYAALKLYDSAYSVLYNEYLAEMDSLVEYINTASNVQEQFIQERTRRQVKEAELMQARAESETRQTVLYAVSVVACLIIAALLAMVRAARSDKKAMAFRQKKLKAETKALQAEKQQKVKENEIERLINEQEQRSMNAMIQGQEKERKRIARDLHDNLGSMLAMVKLHFGSVDGEVEHLAQKHQKQFEKGKLLLDEACKEVRNISHELLSGVLVKFGLLAALKELTTTISGTSALQITLIDVGMDQRLNNELEITLYRIVQELLSNILKHAHAHEVTVQLLQKNQHLRVMVEDDGQGFDQNNGVQKKGIGLKNVQNRVDYLKGEWLIDSGKLGTTISIDIPLHEALVEN